MKSYKFLISFGIFLISVCLVAKQYKPLPDFMQGYIMGTGIGLEILGIARLVKIKVNNART